MDKLLLIIIDEVSNVSTERLARLSKLFAAAKQREDKPFGGIKVLLVGDFNQKGPCAGTLATRDIMNYTKLSEEQKTQETILDNGVFNHTSDTSIGCRILTNCRWLELIQAERSKDKKHNEMVNHLYNGKPVTPQHLKNYKLWSSSTLLDDNEKERLLWLNAPVICKTNREQHSISYL